MVLDIPIAPAKFQIIPGSAVILNMATLLALLGKIIPKPVAVKHRDFRTLSTLESYWETLD